VLYLAAAATGQPKSCAIRAFPSRACVHPQNDGVAVVAAAVDEAAVAELERSRYCLVNLGERKINGIIHTH